MKRSTLKITLTLVLFGLISCNTNKTITDWSNIFEENNAVGTFVLKNMSTQKTYVYNDKRSQIRYVPASTFKILNSMIALQVSSIKSVDDTIKWDGIERDFKSWNSDQTMRTAFPISCVWFYQELARRTKEEQMQEWITKADYGNKKIENEIDLFWLDGNLKISAMEQIEFLEKLIKNELAFDKDIQETVKEIMITDSTESYIMHSKTGWSQQIGWNLGYVETKNTVWAFALNMDMDNIKMAKSRQLITYQILREEGIIK